MLLLTRKVNQEIWLDIGGLKVLIKVSGFDWHYRRVLIGIDANPSITILRGELMSEDEKRVGV